MMRKVTTPTVIPNHQNEVPIRKTYRSGNPDRRRGFDTSDIVAALENDGPSQKTDSGKKPLKGAAN